jgi:hypothetical protein
MKPTFYRLEPNQMPDTALESVTAVILDAHHYRTFADCARAVIEAVQSLQENAPPEFKI